MEKNRKLQDTPEKKAEQKKDRPESKTRADKALESLSQIASVMGGGKG